MVTGGASDNQSILQILSDVFGVTVYTLDSVPNSAALGAAYRALYGWHSREEAMELDGLISEAPHFVLRATPNVVAHREVYRPLVERYKKIEQKLLRQS